MGKKNKKPSTQHQTSATLVCRPYSKDTEKWSTELSSSAHPQGDASWSGAHVFSAKENKENLIISNWL